MRVLKRNKPGIHIPTGWDQITIGQYEDALESLKGAADNYVRAWCGAIAAVTDKQPSEISAQRKITIDQQIVQLSWLSSIDHLQFVNQFDLCGTTYMVNPDITAITADAWIFLNKILREPGPRQRAELVAIFVWPIGESFDPNKFKERAEMLYNKCPCSVLVPLSNFFLQLLNGCAPHIKEHLASKGNSVAQEMIQMLKEMKVEIQKP